MYVNGQGFKAMAPSIIQYLNEKFLRWAGWAAAKPQAKM